MYRSWIVMQFDDRSTLGCTDSSDLLHLTVPFRYPPIKTERRIRCGSAASSRAPPRSAPKPAFALLMTPRRTTTAEPSGTDDAAAIPPDSD